MSIPCCAKESSARARQRAKFKFQRFGPAQFVCPTTAFFFLLPVQSRWYKSSRFIMHVSDPVRSRDSNSSAQISEFIVICTTECWYKICTSIPVLIYYLVSEKNRWNPCRNACGPSGAKTDAVGGAASWSLCNICPTLSLHAWYSVVRTFWHCTPAVVLHSTRNRASRAGRSEMLCRGSSIRLVMSVQCFIQQALLYAL
jgi:hypothetical protein